MAFNLEDFVVEQPRGPITECHPDDSDENEDMVMDAVEFESTQTQKQSQTQTQSSETETETQTRNTDTSIDEESNTLNSTGHNGIRNNPHLLQLANHNSNLSFLTSIAEKIVCYKQKYEERVSKSYQSNFRLREEDQKWQQMIENSINPSSSSASSSSPDDNNNNNDDNNRDDTTMECGDTSSDFRLLGISRILIKCIRDDLQWRYPTPVQRDTIPLALKGHDLMINAMTGSGKSGAFIIPILERLIASDCTQLNERRVLIVTPTRELAIQIYEVFRVFLKTLKPLSICIPIVGGVECDAQFAYLCDHRCDIVVATPGRLIDLLRNYFHSASAEKFIAKRKGRQARHQKHENKKTVSSRSTVDANNVTSTMDMLSQVEVLVLDEADRLLSMGFQPELFEILRHLSAKQFRQNILCSATLTDSVMQLAEMTLNQDNMKRVAVDASLALNASRLTQEFIRLQVGQEKYRKAMLLALLLTTFRRKKCIIFCRTKKETHFMRILCAFFGLRCMELHADLSQFDRLTALQQFKEDDALKFLFCTDIASRGIDIHQLDLVINIEFPANVKTYIHRVGRTARAGKCGYACTFVADSRKKLLKQLLQSDANKNGVIKSRTLNHEFVLWCARKISEMKTDIELLIKSETKERDMRHMHIQLKRSENLLMYENEIMKKKKRSWIMTRNDKLDLRAKAKEEKIGAMTACKEARFAGLPKIEREKRQQKVKEKMFKKRDIEWGKKLGHKAVAMKRSQQRQQREENKTRTGGDVVDMIKHPYKYNKNVRKNILLKMKKNKSQKVRNYASQDMLKHGGGAGRIKKRFQSASNGSGSGGQEKKWQNKRLKKKMSNKGNKTRFKNRRR